MTYQEQPMPTPNDGVCVQDEVIKDLLARKEVGIQRYGTALQAFNGRNPAIDFYEELLDAPQYAKQLIIEREAMVEAFHKIAEATSVNAANMEAFLMLVKLGEVEDEQSS